MGGTGKGRRPRRKEPGKRDESVLRAIAHLCRRLTEFPDQSPAVQSRFLEDLGLAPADARRVLDIYIRLPAIPRPDAFRRVGPRIPVPTPGLTPCPIGWQPSVLTPVFYGIQDLDEGDGAPGPLRIFYPSLDGSVYDVPIVEGCGRYPLIVFVHGHCSEAEHYKKWYLVPAQLARSGYVVVAPALPGTATGEYPWNDPSADLSLLEDVRTWMRNEWTDGDVLMPSPATGVVGHSYGALLGGRLAAAGGVSAYASLSGVWHEYPPPAPLADLGVPALFTWGTGFSEFSTPLGSGAGSLWAQVVEPKHRVIFNGGEHWDYLLAGVSDCEGDRGACEVVKTLAADFVAVFMGKYMPPEGWAGLGGLLPDSLIAPPFELTEEQMFYAGGHLMGLSLIAGNDACSATHSWDTPAGTGEILLSGA